MKNSLPRIKCGAPKAKAIAAALALIGAFTVSPASAQGSFNPHGDSAPLPNPHGPSTPLPPSRSVATTNQRIPDRLPMFCWLAYGTNRDDRVAYITRVFMAPLAAGNQGQIADQFEAFVRKTYGQTTRGASCPEERSDDTASIATSEKARNFALDGLRDLKYGPIKIINLDWAPPVVASVPATRPATAAPQPRAQQTYEQALAAQRPAAAGTPPAPRTSLASAVTPAVRARPVRAAANEKYSYCIAVGGPRRSEAHHSYVTQVFAITPRMNPTAAFGVFVRRAHPQDALGAVRCGYPQTQSLVESARQDDINSQRGDSHMQVFDVNWKPPQ